MVNKKEIRKFFAEHKEDAGFKMVMTGAKAKSLSHKERVEYIYANLRHRYQDMTIPFAMALANYVEGLMYWERG